MHFPSCQGESNESIIHLQAALTRLEAPGPGAWPGHSDLVIMTNCGTQAI